VTRALVLGGGGVVGVGWETGVLLGLAERGVDLRTADLVVGTSAGATVGAQATSGVPLDELFARQLAPPEESGEIAVPLDGAELVAMFSAAVRGAPTPRDARVAVAALPAPASADPVARRAVIERRLPVHTWPACDLRVTAVDVVSGDLVMFSASSGVPLVDAVMASCAVPGVWPQVAIGGRKYVDGGVRSGTNADLADGCDTVVVIGPVITGPMTSLDPTVAAAVAEMVARPSTVAIEADAGARAAMGASPLDPAARAPSAHAGRRQGHAIAAELAACW
jgi:NTE family protein